MRVVLAAEESAGLQTLRLLDASEDHDLVAVMTSGTGPTSVGGAARELGVPVWEPALVREPELARRLEGTGVDLLLNVHSLYLVDADVLDAPNLGSFNLHPGPLPGYAGLNAPSWAIMEGESRHGVTLHWMTAEIDAGSVAYESHFEIDDEETGLSLSAKCVRHGMGLVRRLLADAAGDPASIPALRQQGERRYLDRGPPYGGRLRWSLPARQIDALVRACDYGPFPSPWGRPVAVLDGSEIEILRASLTGAAADVPAGTVSEGGWVATADEWLAVKRARSGGRTLGGSEALAIGSVFDLDGE